MFGYQQSGNLAVASEIRISNHNELVGLGIDVLLYCVETRSVDASHPLAAGLAEQQGILVGVVGDPHQNQIRGG